MPRRSVALWAAEGTMADRRIAAMSGRLEGTDGQTRRDIHGARAGPSPDAPRPGEGYPKNALAKAIRMEPAHSTARTTAMTQCHSATKRFTPPEAGMTPWLMLRAVV